MEKAIYFDMDGTIANFYQVDKWLDKIRASDVSPYLDALPLVDISKAVKILTELQSKGWTIGIISWLAMNSTKKFEDRTRYAKKKWLQKYFDFNFDEIHFTKYGRSKSAIAKYKNGILFDDNDQVRKEWKGLAFNEKNILENLKAIII